ncbi:MAG TPA: hypothetical protein VFY71_15280 [Planctomycetota bacterium]|nr:hypothetical protein [Planctomycetota bacterium]
MLLLASLAHGQALAGEVANADIVFPPRPALVGSVPAAPASELDDRSPLGMDDERFAQLLREDPDSGSSDSLGFSAISTILLGLALLCAAGPMGRLVAGLEKPPRPRRADDPGS